MQNIWRRQSLCVCCCGAEPWHHQVLFLTIAQPVAFILHARWINFLGIRFGSLNSTFASTLCFKNCLESYWCSLFFFIAWFLWPTFLLANSKSIRLRYNNVLETTHKKQSRGFRLMKAHFFNFLTNRFGRQ